MRDRRRVKHFNKLMLEGNKTAANSKKEPLTSLNTDTENTVITFIPAKSTKLVFYKQYYTYQAFLEIYPINDLNVDGCYLKTILYIMRWFRSRMGEDVYDKYPTISYLRDDYPEPENYTDFDLEKSDNINGFNFIDFETAYLNNKNAWLVCLTEPDNGNEKKDVHDRTFKTEMFVHKLAESVALGIRESCREPDTNPEDARGYRPKFVRDMFFDRDMVITEFGIDKKYAFGTKPIMLNGKSGEACEKIYNDLIASDDRQMPVLFVPGEYYKENSDEVDRKTQSLLGYTHIVVWEDSCGKLFGQKMKSDELAEVAGEGQLIFYRTTNKQEYTSDYYNTGEANHLDEMKERAQKETCRKNVSFKNYVFKPAWWEMDKVNSAEKILADAEERENAYKKQISDLEKSIEGFKKDNDDLQRKIDRLESENNKLGKDCSKLSRDSLRHAVETNNLGVVIKELKEKNYKNEAIIIDLKHTLNGYKGVVKEQYLPIINLPVYSKDIRSELVDWIKKYYSDVIMVHDDAIQALNREKRNIDWHRICMMIHYIAGYTRYRNDNAGPVDDPNIARDYDPEDSGYKVEPTSSGQGATEIHKDKYTISYEGKNALLDMHIKYGKGSDADMIRIYFYYDPDMKKSVIGYMPGHLPTRKDGH